MKSARAYRMVARAESTEQTRLAILEAMTRLVMKHELDDVTLDVVAREAGVALPTVLRHFGSKDGLIDAAGDHGGRAIFASRVPDGRGVRAVVRVLVASYEKIHELNWRLLRAETSHPGIGRVLAKARADHRQWLATQFARSLPERDRERTLDLLFTATDFYVWKLHRRDLEMSREVTEDIMVRLVEAVLA